MSKQRVENKGIGPQDLIRDGINQINEANDNRNAIECSVLNSWFNAPNVMEWIFAKQRSEGQKMFKELVEECASKETPYNASHYKGALKHMQNTPEAEWGFSLRNRYKLYLDVRTIEKAEKESERVAQLTPAERAQEAREAMTKKAEKVAAEGKGQRAKVVKAATTALKLAANHPDLLAALVEGVPEKQWAERLQQLAS